MYSGLLKKEAVEQMQKEARRLREEYLEYAEDMELFANPEFWNAIEDVENRKTRKMSLDELRRELKL